jgi:superfamily II DNA helicase RecQ
MRWRFRFGLALVPPGTVPNSEVAQGEQPHDLEEASEEAARAQEHRGQFDRSRVEMIRGYAEAHACRREYLLNYFVRSSTTLASTVTTAKPVSWLRGSKVRNRSPSTAVWSTKNGRRV